MSVDIGSIVKTLGNYGPENPYQTSLLIVSPEIYQTSEELETFLINWKATSGWIARQSGVEVFEKGAMPDNSTLGHIVSAELTNGETSFHIKRLATKWIVTTLEQKTGEKYLFDVVKHLTVKHGAAVYHRFWTIPDNGAAEIFAWRFVGFEEVKT